VSDLIVIVFNDEQQARDALGTLRKYEHEGVLSLKDTAVLTKDAHGKVHVKNEASSATETGAVVGAVLGPLLAFMFPVVGIAIGALGGAAIGALLGDGVDRGFVKEMTTSLEPGKSALFLVIQDVNPAVFDALKPFSGKVYQTTLSEDVEDRLTRALA
jgi:uncharacterized membrane protein